MARASLITFAQKPRVSVHKFASCDGCQLAFLNLGPQLLELASMLEFVHFLEAGMSNPDAEVDIAFVEGSVSTEADIQRIKDVRAKSRMLISLGACATSGGLQALRNFTDGDAWRDALYPDAQYIQSLKETHPLKEHVKVDYELWGCPVSGQQVLTIIRQILLHSRPNLPDEKLCLECKRQNNVCTLVTQQSPCMGAVTRTGCGALCPSAGRDCYGCFGLSENPNTTSLANRIEGLGFMGEEVGKRFRFIHNTPQPLQEESRRWLEPNTAGGQHD